MTIERAAVPRIRFQAISQQVNLTGNEFAPLRWNLIEAIGHVPEMREGLRRSPMPHRFPSPALPHSSSSPGGQQQVFDEIFVRVRRLEPGIVLVQGSPPQISEIYENKRTGESTWAPVLL